MERSPLEGTWQPGFAERVVLERVVVPWHRGLSTAEFPIQGRVFPCPQLMSASEQRSRRKKTSAPVGLLLGIKLM